MEKFKLQFFDNDNIQSITYLTRERIKVGIEIDGEMRYFNVYSDNFYDKIKSMIDTKYLTEIHN